MFFQRFQSRARASCPTASGCGYGHANVVSFLFSSVANRSTSKGPQTSSNHLKNRASRAHSVGAGHARDKRSALTFNTPARWWGSRCQRLDFKMSPMDSAQLRSGTDLADPIFLSTDTTVVLSVNRRIVEFGGSSIVLRAK